jgi:hypothetical protein
MVYFCTYLVGKIIRDSGETNGPGGVEGEEMESCRVIAYTGIAVYGTMDCLGIVTISTTQWTDSDDNPTADIS